MSSGGVRPEALVSLGFCRTCGAELAAGKPHEDTCAEEAFVQADPEYRLLSGSELDAREDYELVRRRGRGASVARARQKHERCEQALKAREAELRAAFRKK